MGVKTFSDNNSETKYNFHRKGGRSIIERPPIFSPDEESVVIIVENTVRVYNIQTGDYVRSLETESTVDELIGIQFPEDEDYNLYSCSSCGCVTTWTWENGAVLRDVKLAIPKAALVITFDLLDSKECFVTAFGGPYKNFIHLGTYSVKTGELLQEFNNTKPFYKDIVRVSLGWCNGDRFAAISNGTKCLFIQNLYKPHVKSEILNYNKFRILTVSAHSRENAVVITDTLGRVTIIRGNLFDHTKVAREVMHWHFLPAMAACFSTQGTYLYSGGMEKVLVKWTTGHLTNKANEKSFIPRLPGMVRYIAVNNTHVAVTLTNNSVVIASTLMQVVCTLLECGGLSPAARAAGSALAHHAALGALLVGGRTGHLQLFSTTTGKVLYNIDITRKNNIPPARRNLLPLETEVTCAAVSADGSWLVTSEYRNDGITYPEEMLKFWSLQQNANPFRLNTCVNLSHGGCNVVSLALNNKGEFCVSAGSDQKFRIWKRDTQPSGKKVSWTCQTACYYSSGIAQFLSSKVLNNFKIGEGYSPGEVEEFPYLTQHKNNDIIVRLFNVHKEHNLFDSKMLKDNSKRDDFDMGGVAISQDGSLIAAWFGCKLTLWDTHLCSLRTTLSHPALRPKGVHVQFGNHDAAHYLVCTTEKCVAVWSLLSLTVKWLVPLNATYLAADPLSNKMAVTTSNNDVFVFSPHNSTPILSRKSLLNPKTGVFKLCTFGTSTDDDIRLYVMRNDSEIYCLEPEQSEESRLEVMSRRNLPASNFRTLLAEQQLSDVRAAVPAEIHALGVDPSGHAALSQFLISSPHMVPPVSLLCTAFLQSMSGQEQPEEPIDDQEDEMDVEPDSSDEESDETKMNGPYAPKATQLWTPNYEGIKEKRLRKILKEPFLDLHTTQALFEV